MKFLFSIVVAEILTSATADMYLQFPGGSNNRLNESHRSRRNAKRLFDSQNNNRFGHNQHGHYFYTDSEIDMQWTVQHSCGPDSNLNCDIILQYACEDNLRDGEMVHTIPENSAICQNNDCNTDYRYGMHESFESFQHCSLRERNKGLFPADRNIRGEDARFTRQENHGTRYGYECNEERDHYPYWHPSIWRDIAVFTDDTSRCPYYQQESENVKGRWYCHVSDEFLNENYDPEDNDAAIIPINKVDCEELADAEWRLSDPHKYPNGAEMQPPVCEAAPYQRDNHHGNGDSRYFIGYKWTVPENLVHENCAIRIRYNITSSDYDAWNIDYDAKQRNDRLKQRPSTHAGKCYGIGEGPAQISGYSFDDLEQDWETALDITPRKWGDERIKLTRNSTEASIWRLQTQTHGGWQWIGWKDESLGGKNIQVKFKVKFDTKPTGGHYGMKFFGKLVNDWVDEAPIGEWHNVILNETLRTHGDGYHIIMIFDNVSVDLEIEDFELCDSEGNCYKMGEGKSIISGHFFDSLGLDMETATEINPRLNYNIKMTRDDVESPIWRIQTKTHGGWQWVGWRDSHLGNQKVKLSFDVKFTKKPISGTGNYGVKMFSKQMNDWVDDAPLGEWYHVEFEEILPLNGHGEYIILKFDGVSVDFELKNVDLCVADELGELGNPYYSMQDAFGWDSFEAKNRGYEHRNDARLQIFDRIPMKLRSAYNTDQLGRVFEDRSHKIQFVQLPADIKEDMTLNNKKLYNLNARGKIGNNVEVYPAFEYDFAPSRLVANEGDYVHIQWSGSNTNDNWNDHSQRDQNGNPITVLRGKDRHNMVAIDSMDAIRPTSDLEKLSSLIGLSTEDSMKLAFSGLVGGDNEYLQSAGAYFDLGPRKLVKKGKHMFMSTINNAAGIRTQKGKIIVQ